MTLPTTDNKLAWNSSSMVSFIEVQLGLEQNLLRNYYLSRKKARDDVFLVHIVDGGGDT